MFSVPFLTIGLYFKMYFYQKFETMSNVAINHIEAAIDKIDTLDDNAIDRLSEAQTTAQPVLLGYVMSAPEEYNNVNLESLLIYYYTVILEAFSQAGLHPETVSEEFIDGFEEEFFDVLDKYYETDDDSLLEDYSNQPDLVRFLAMEVGAEDEEGVTLDDETATQLFIVLFAMVSLLSRNLK